MKNLTVKIFESKGSCLAFILIKTFCLPHSLNDDPQCFHNKSVQVVYGAILMCQFALQILHSSLLFSAKPFNKYIDISLPNKLR